MSSSLYPSQTLLSSNLTSGFTDPLAVPSPIASNNTPLRWFVVDFLHGEDSEDNLSSWSSFIGIVIAIGGNILISLALNIQKYAHTKIERDAQRKRAGRLKARQLEIDRRRTNHDVESPDVGEGASRELSRTLSKPSHALGRGNGVTQKRNGPDETSTLLLRSEKDREEPAEVFYITSPYWVLGFVMMFFGESCNFLAYAFTAASIVSPLGVVALISNCVVAPMMLKEPFRTRDAMGVLVSVAGAVVVVLSAEKEETKLGPDEILEAVSQTAFLVYFGITSILIVVLMRLSSRCGQKTIMIDLGLVALFGGYTVLSTKGISSLISSSFYHIFQYPIAYLFTFVLASTAILQVKYINRALQRFDSTQVIPTQFVLFTISVIVGSAILYRDFETVGGKRLVKFIIGCSLTFVGVYLISSRRQRSQRTLDFEEEDGECAELLTPPNYTDESSSHLDGGSAESPTSSAFRPPFYRTVSAVSSNGVSIHNLPGSAAVARGLQLAAADPLFSTLPSEASPRRRVSSETIHRTLELMPGSNLMTGYQLQTVIAERLNSSLSRALGRDGEEESVGANGRMHRRRRSSLSMVLDFVKGKRKVDVSDGVEETQVEEEEEEEDGEDNHGHWQNYGSGEGRA